jgi:hypothetical protein
VGYGMGGGWGGGGAPRSSAKVSNVAYTRVVPKLLQVTPSRILRSQRTARQRALHWTPARVYGPKSILNPGRHRATNTDNIKTTITLRPFLHQGRGATRTEYPGCAPIRKPVVLANFHEKELPCEVVSPLSNPNCSLARTSTVG